MPPTKADLPHEVQVDIYIARRKRMHTVFDPDGIPVFTGPHILQVLNWLHENDLDHARFTDEETSFDVTFRPCSLNHQPFGERNHG